MADERRPHLLSQIRGLLHLAGTDEQAAKAEFDLLCREHDRTELASVVATVYSEFERSHGF